MYAMEVKTVLNLEADARCLCQDSVTYTQEMHEGDYQENLDAVFLQSGKKTACSDRSLDCFNCCWCFHLNHFFVRDVVDFFEEDFILFLVSGEPIIDFQPATWMLTSRLSEATPGSKLISLIWICICPQRTAM